MRIKAVVRVVLERTAPPAPSGMSTLKIRGRGGVCVSVCGFMRTGAVRSQAARTERLEIKRRGENKKVHRSLPLYIFIYKEGRGVFHAGEGIISWGEDGGARSAVRSAGTC